MTAFFPSAEFGIVFMAMLLAGLAVASWHDLKTLIVPKRVTISLAVAGLAMNAVRGGWLAALGQPGWAFDSTSWLGGGVDGFLFAGAGLLVGFTFFFVLWIFGVCGGGDVKLAAAVGAWMGPRYFFGVVALALPVLVLFTVVRLGVVLVRGGSRPNPTAPAMGMQWRIMSFSLPMTLAVLGMIVFGFRVELGMAGAAAN